MGEKAKPGREHRVDPDFLRRSWELLKIRRAGGEERATVGLWKGLLTVLVRREVRDGGVLCSREEWKRSRS